MTQKPEVFRYRKVVINKVPLPGAVQPSQQGPTYTSNRTRQRLRRETCAAWVRVLAPNM